MVAVRFFPSAGNAEASVTRSWRSAALQLAEREGWDTVTVDAITTAAALSRRTFFRYFPTKEDVLFSDHAEYLTAVEGSLRFSTGSAVTSAAAALETVTNALHADANFVFRRQALVAHSTSLQDRETLWYGEYEKVLHEFLCQHNRPGPARINSAALIGALRYSIAAWISAPAATPDPTVEYRRVAPTAATAPEDLSSNESSSKQQVSEVVIVRSTLNAAQITQLLLEATQDDTEPPITIEMTSSKSEADYPMS